MTANGIHVLRWLAAAMGSLALLAGAPGCDRGAGDRLQGYVEGELVFVGPALAGRLVSLEIARGDRVQPGDPLFSLDAAPQAMARERAARRLDEGRALLADARRGSRSTEIASIEAERDLAATELELAERDLSRLEALTRSDAASVRELDDARSRRDQSRHRVTRLEADLATARLGAREDRVAAAEASVRALEAELARAEWDLEQMARTAPVEGSVFETFHRPGEWVEAGRPVVALLPPHGVHVRAFVPESRIAMVSVGRAARVSIDGVAQPVEGRVSFVSPTAEYTPPVIYSRESRAKLVFRIEIAFDPAVAATLHPGQPVDVEVGAGP